jgi:hypothetical protein
MLIKKEICWEFAKGTESWCHPRFVARDELNFHDNLVHDTMAEHSKGTVHKVALEPLNINLHDIVPIDICHIQMNVMICGEDLIVGHNVLLTP